MFLFRNISRIARLTLLALVSVVALTIGAVHLAVAHAKGELLELGRHLSAIGETAAIGGRTIVLNGQPLGFRVATTAAPPSTVLDHFEAWCRGGTGAFTDEIDAVGWIEQSSASDESWRDFTVREEDGERGFVACIKTGAVRPDLSELGERVARFGESGNLADFGRFHYAYVEPGQEATRLVAVWTAGEFYPGRLFPETGDAPGADVPGVPRPPTGRRLLSAGEIGQDYGLTTYIEGQQSVSELVAFYRERLPRHGWQILADAPVEDGVHSLVIERADRLLVIVLGLDDDGRSTVTIASASGDNA